MKSLLKLTTAAAVLAGSAAICAPAGAAFVSVGLGPGFDIHTGGYCDRWGCPADYWAYPIYYGPVFYNNVWYRGPVYYRTVNGTRWYWVHGGWRRDQWRGPRPTWARHYHYGPALGLAYYRTHGFRVREGDWRVSQDQDYRQRTGYGDNDQGGTYGNEERNPDTERGVDRDRYRDYDQTYDRDMYDRNRDYGPRDEDQYGRGGEDQYGPGGEDQYGGGGEDQYGPGGQDQYGRGGEDQYGGDEDQYGPGDEDQYGRGSEYGPDYDRYPGTVGYHRDRTHPRSGYDHNRGAYQHGNYAGSGGASGTGTMSHGTTHHATHGTSHHHNTSSPPDHGYTHTQYRPDQDRLNQDRMHGDTNRTRSDDQMRDHGNSGQSDQNRDQNRDQGRSGSENGYEHTNYPQQQPGEHGHAKPPPVTTHSSQRPKPNQDDEAPPSD